MITFFTCPKPFIGKTSVIQKNAIRSWTPHGKIILCGDETGVKEFAEDNGLKHLPGIKVKNEVPLVNSIFQEAIKASSEDYLCYINTDIILLPDFQNLNLKAIEAGGPDFLIVAENFNTDIKGEIEFSEGWEKAIQKGPSRGPHAIDLFLFNRHSSEVFADMPDFYIGRPCWDNWVIWKFAKKSVFNINIIDASPLITLIHQNHDYLSSGGFKAVWDGPRAEYNRELCETKNRMSINDAKSLLLEPNYIREKTIADIEKSKIDFMCGLISSAEKAKDPKIALDYLEHAEACGPTKPIQEEITRIKNSLKFDKINILVSYSAKNPITLPRWICQALQSYYSREVNVFQCGPNNEIPIKDDYSYFFAVKDIIKKNNIDVLWDIEGAGSAEFLFKRFPENFNAIDIPKVTWMIDTHQFLPMQKEKAAHFDLVYVAQKNATEHIPGSEWLPAGAAIHEKDHCLNRFQDVAFIGNVSAAHCKRKKLLEYLIKNLPDFRIITDVFEEEKARVTSQYKIIVNQSLNNDINFRVFETMACGALLITDRIIYNGFEELFEDGRHCIVFNSHQDCLEKIKFFLSHPKEREAIAKNGKELVQSKYMHNHILKKVIADFRELKKRGGKKEIQSGETCFCGGSFINSIHKFYYQCQSCGVFRIKTLPTDDSQKNFYTFQNYWHDHQVIVNSFPAIEERAINDASDRVLSWWELVKNIAPGCNSLLEIGCAPGAFLSKCRDNGIKVFGVEPDEATCEFIKSKFNLENVIPGLFPDIDISEKFDLICAFDMFEHTTEPIRTLEKMKSLLSPGGRVLLQTPCYAGEGPEFTHFRTEKGEHPFIYTKYSIVRAAKLAGLKAKLILPGYFPGDMFVIMEVEK